MALAAILYPKHSRIAANPRDGSLGASAARMILYPLLTLLELLIRISFVELKRNLCVGAILECVASEQLPCPAAICLGAAT